MSIDPTDKIVITKDELQDQHIDERLAQQRTVGPGAVQPIEEKRGLRVLLAAWFYLFLAGGVGALIGWALVEPYFDDWIIFTGRVQQVAQEDFSPGLRPVVISEIMVLIPTIQPLWGGPEGRVAHTVDDLIVGTVVRVQANEAVVQFDDEEQWVSIFDAVPENTVALVASAVRVEPAGTSAPTTHEFADLLGDMSLVSMTLFAGVAAMVGLFIGGVEGVVCRTFKRALRCGLMGLGVGLVGGVVASFVAGAMYALLGGGEVAESTGDFILQMLSRGLAWALVGSVAGIGQGLALKSSRLFLNGLIGGMAGGLVGGLLFDPIDLMISDPTRLQGAEVSRAIGLTMIGCAVGLMIGVTNLITRTAWLRVVAGPLRGKEFNFDRTPIRLGSSPKNEIYLFKDPRIDPVHATIHKLRDTFEIRDAKSSSGTFVNGQRVERRRLSDGDRIQIGEAEFIYATREKSHATG